MDAGNERVERRGKRTSTSTLVFMENPVTHTYGFSTFDLLPARVLPCYCTVGSDSLSYPGFPRALGGRRWMAKRSNRCSYIGHVAA